jgi:two-component system C4-dicarboxylate transport sensor histidine kinase DctB
MAIHSLKACFNLIKRLNRPKVLSHIAVMDPINSDNDLDSLENSLSRNPITARVFLFSLSVLFVVLLVATNSFFTSKYLNDIKQEGEIRLAQNERNIVNELQKNSVIPQFLVRDQSIWNALLSNNFSSLPQMFSEFINEISIESITLMDRTGQIVAVAGKENLNVNSSNKIIFNTAISTNDTVMNIIEKNENEFGFFYSRKIENDQRVLGVLSIEVDLKKFENSWKSAGDRIFISNGEGKIVLATEPTWKGLSDDLAWKNQNSKNIIKRGYSVAKGWVDSNESDQYFNDSSFVRFNKNIPILNWKISSFENYSGVRERVNTILALEILIFLLLLVLSLYSLNRKKILRLNLFEEETIKLRELNKKLETEMEQRKRVEKNLLAVEQTLEQHSKLAALGEMSAAISHELNQPLAAMKTYLAGASLLLKRNRPQETVAALMRIDGLIHRMGEITKQLKSFARKNTESFVPLNFNDAILEAMSIMEPQLKQSGIKIDTNIPSEPVLIVGDQQRLEQVIINLIRNAIDALDDTELPSITISLYKNNSVRFSIRDNGKGINNLEKLFEPFQTSKDPGKGLGLGLAISSNIISELGGSLSGENLTPTGAEFTIKLPLFDPSRVNVVEENQTKMRETL